VTDKPKYAITPTVRLQAFAMMQLARRYYFKCRDLERSASALLGVDFYRNYFSDLIYDRNATELDFDNALVKEGISVTTEPLDDEMGAIAGALERADKTRSDL
jgi:hypothetical protein